MMAADWESDAIARWLHRPGRGNPAVVRGIGDDAALLALAPGEVLAVSVDTLVEGRHFPRRHDDPGAIGHQALAVNLSDLAATAATPRAAFMALTLPVADEDWLAAFAAGFHALADAHGVILAGGDLTCGARTISIMVCGTVPRGLAQGRRGAAPGDHILVSGQLGGAALGYRCLEGSAPPLSATQRARCLQRLLRPDPRDDISAKSGGSLAGKMV